MKDNLAKLVKQSENKELLCFDGNNRQVYVDDRCLQYVKSAEKSNNGVWTLNHQDGRVTTLTFFKQMK